MYHLGKNKNAFHTPVRSTVVLSSSTSTSTHHVPVDGRSAMQLQSLLQRSAIGRSLITVISTFFVAMQRKMSFLNRSTCTRCLSKTQILFSALPPKGIHFCFDFSRCHHLPSFPFPTTFIFSATNAYFSADRRVEPLARTHTSSYVVISWISMSLLKSVGGMAKMKQEKWHEMTWNDNNLMPIIILNNVLNSRPHARGWPPLSTQQCPYARPPVAPVRFYYPSERGRENLTAGNTSNVTSPLLPRISMTTRSLLALFTVV